MKIPSYLQNYMVKISLFYEFREKEETTGIKINC